MTEEPQPPTCPQCSQRCEWAKCPTCGGDGWGQCHECDGGTSGWTGETCGVCDGSSILTCSQCHKANGRWSCPSHGFFISVVREEVVGEPANLDP